MEINQDGDFPDGPVGKNTPSNSNSGDVGLSPGRGTKIPYAAVNQARAL